MEIAANKGIAIPTVIDLRILKPLDFNTIDKILMKTSKVIVVEDNYTAAGIGEAIAARADEIASPCRIKIVGIPPVFVTHATVKRQREICGITAENVVSSYLN
jgi:1-deoxy-D-xylulose-5-phosphate synthase